MLAESSVTPRAISELSAREMRRSVWRRWGLRLSVVVGWCVFIGVWYALSRLVFDTRRLPDPHVVVAEAYTIIVERDFLSNIRASLLRVVAGFLLASVLSAGLGLLVAYNPWWRNLLRRLLVFIAGTPTVSLAILALILFGVSPVGPILTTTLVATPYIVMNVAEGLTGVDRRLIVMSESFGRSRAQIIWGVLFPSSLLAVLGGARIAFAVAWRMELLTEVFAASEGVGFQIRRSFESYDIRSMLAWTILFIGVMLILENLVFRRIEQRMYGGSHSGPGVAR